MKYYIIDTIICRSICRRLLSISASGRWLKVMLNTQVRFILSIHHVLDIVSARVLRDLYSVVCSDSLALLLFLDSTVKLCLTSSAELRSRVDLNCRIILSHYGI